MDDDNLVAVEFVPGSFITCRVLRCLEVKEGWLEILCINPLLDELEYVYVPLT